MSIPVLFTKWILVSPPHLLQAKSGILYIVFLIIYWFQVITLPHRWHTPCPSLASGVAIQCSMINWWPNSQHSSFILFPFLYWGFLIILNFPTITNIVSKTSTFYTVAIINFPLMPMHSFHLMGFHVSLLRVNYNSRHTLVVGQCSHYPIY